MEVDTVFKVCVQAGFIRGHNLCLLSLLPSSFLIFKLLAFLQLIQWQYLL